jgi:hypothetical protein
LEFGGLGLGFRVSVEAGVFRIWVLEFGSWNLGLGIWILEFGFWNFGMNSKQSEVLKVKNEFSKIDQDGSQSIGSLPAPARSSFVFEKCRQPKNPRYTDNGEGCTALRI